MKSLLGLVSFDLCFLNGFQPGTIFPLLSGTRLIFRSVSLWNEDHERGPTEDGGRATQEHPNNYDS